MATPSADKGRKAGFSRPSTLSPFQHRVFLALWVASMAANLGNAIQSVGASWLMTSIDPRADMIALVQTAVSLPIMCFALVAGAIADVYDRRRVMLVAQLLMFTASVLLALLAYLGLVTPWLLLGLTFVLGAGVALLTPTMQATIGDVVPRSELSGAVSLNVVGFNVARSVGPAIGGAIVAMAGSSFAFVVNASTYLLALIILLLWRREPAPAFAHRESLGRALKAGVQYVAFAPAIRTVMLRAFTFTLCGAAAWALMPLVARDLVGGGPAVFGMLLGALGFGAVLGALMSTAVRQRFSNEAIIRGAGIIYGVACVIAAMKPGLASTALVLVIGGAGWVQALSGFSVSAQLWSPRWVVGRVSATVNTMNFGGLAIGAWAWGHVAESFGVTAAIGASGVAMVLLPLIGLKYRLPRNEDANIEVAGTPWTEPAFAARLEPRSGPIIVTTEYRISPEAETEFIAAMGERRRVLRRDGASRWTLMQDIENDDRWLERFYCATWVDWQRQHQRRTTIDRQLEARIASFQKIGSAPQTSYFLGKRSVKL